MGECEHRVSPKLLLGKRHFDISLAIVTTVAVANTASAVAGVALALTTAVADTLDCLYVEVASALSVQNVIDGYIQLGL